MAAKLLSWSSAGLLAAGLAATQLLLGGWAYPALAAPGFLMVGASAVAAGLLFRGGTSAPGPWCVGIALLAAAYFLWCQASPPDAYAASADQWLLLAALSVYWVAAWHLRGDGPRWLVLGVVFVLAVGQVLLVVAQFAAEHPFHPLAGLAPGLGLPGGGEELSNPGYVSGTLASRTGLSGVLEASTFLALGMLIWGKCGTAVRLILLWVVAAGFAGLALCLSRSAYLGTLAALGVFSLVSFFIVWRGTVSHRWMLAGLAVFLVAVSLALAVTMASGSIAIQLRLADLQVDEYRERLWFITVPPMLSLDPWFGAGAGMFDQLSLRYRGSGFGARPVHAHNDWLQLLVEYGRLGLGLAAAFVAVHCAAGWREAMCRAREAREHGMLPQSTELGLATGSLAAITAVGVHAGFDYSLHVPAAVLPAALCAGWLAGARGQPANVPPRLLPLWLRLPAFVLPCATGAALLWVVAREAPAERLALQAANALFRREPGPAWDLALEGLAVRPRNPRLLALAGDAAGQLGNAAADAAEREDWYARAADYFDELTRERPLLAQGWRERAFLLDLDGRPREALPAHLRAIARDPDHARGYEYLAVHFWRLGRTREAERLRRLAATLPGARLWAQEFPVPDEPPEAHPAPEESSLTR